MSFNLIDFYSDFDSGSGLAGRQGGSILPELIQGSQLANLHLPPNFVTGGPFLPTAMLSISGFECILRFAQAVQILTQL